MSGSQNRGLVIGVGSLALLGLIGLYMSLAWQQYLARQREEVKILNEIVRQANRDELTAKRIKDQLESAGFRVHAGNENDDPGLTVSLMNGRAGLWIIGRYAIVRQTDAGVFEIEVYEQASAL